MMSVFKFHQALAVADCLDKKGLPLSTAIHISEEELRENTHSPLRDAYPKGKTDITIEELLVYIAIFRQQRLRHIVRPW